MMFAAVYSYSNYTVVLFPSSDNVFINAYCSNSSQQIYFHPNETLIDDGILKNLIIKVLFLKNAFCDVKGYSVALK